MEYVEFVNTFHKMCSKICTTVGCHNCPLDEPMRGYGGDCPTWIVDNPEKAEELIGEWLLKNPPWTNMSRFMENYPEMLIASDGFPSIPPCNIDKTLRARTASGACLSCRGISCGDCRKEFWEKEIE